jgi:hypothetical protein
MRLGTNSILLGVGAAIALGCGGRALATGPRADGGNPEAGGGSVLATGPEAGGGNPDIRRAPPTCRATTSVNSTALASTARKALGSGSASRSTASAPRATRAASTRPATPMRIARRGSTAATTWDKGATCAVSAARVTPGREGPTRPARSERCASRSLPESPGAAGKIDLSGVDSSTKSCGVRASTVARARKSDPE